MDIQVRPNPGSTFKGRSGNNNMSFSMNGGKRQSYLRKKYCRFCADKSLKIDYKNFEILKKFTTIGGKIIPRRISGNCSKHQKILTSAIKRARYISFLPYVKK